MGSGGASGQRAQVWGESALETPLQMRRLAALSRRAISLATDTNQAGLQTFKIRNFGGCGLDDTDTYTMYNTDTDTATSSILS